LLCCPLLLPLLLLLLLLLLLPLPFLACSGTAAIPQQEWACLAVWSGHQRRAWA
jgi:hypothetical protein